MTKPHGSNAKHKDLVASCHAYLTWCGAWTFKVVGGLGQRTGMPDMLAAFPPDGRLVAVECKTGLMGLRPNQRVEQAALEARGVVYVLVRELEDLEGALIRSGLVARPRLLDWAGERSAGHHSRSAR